MAAFAYDLKNILDARRNYMSIKWHHSGTMDNAVSEREKKHRELAKKAAAEGIVLLKNAGILPLKLSEAIAVFGNGAEKTVKGGIGSGDVNNRENISIYRGIVEAGGTVTDEEWIGDYEERYKAAREEWKDKVLEDAKHVQNPFDAYAANPFILPEGRRITEEDLGKRERLLRMIGPEKLSSDQYARLYDIAVDLSLVTAGELDDIKEMATGMGACMAQSSIHLNIWFGDYSKLKGLLSFMSIAGIGPDELKEGAAYIGDALNDEELFDFFPLSFGTASVALNRASFSHLPAFICRSEGGEGFSEAASAILGRL